MYRGCGGSILRRFAPGSSRAVGEGCRCTDMRREQREETALRQSHVMDDFVRGNESRGEAVICMRLNRIETARGE